MELSFSHFDYKINLVQQRELFKDCFPETNGETIQGKAHYIWKFHSFPSDIKSWEYASYIEKDMVGYYAAIPYQYKIGNKTTPVGMVCDVMTSSKYRGRGIFTKMGIYSTRELATQIPFSMGYPIRKEVIPGHLKVGWRIPFNMPLYMKFIRLDSLLKDKNLGFVAPFANIFVSMYNYLRRSRISKQYSSQLYTDINDVEGYNSFVEEWSKSVRNTLVKDLSFAQWRYSAPKRNYKFLSIFSNEKMVGFVSFRYIIKKGVPSYGLLDYMVLSGYEDCSGTINAILVNCAKKDKVETIMTMMSKSSASTYQLSKNGYFKSPFVFSLIIKNLTNEFSDGELFKEENWHLMWVDSDDL